ncbi:MAG: ABC transporter permease [Lewinellaceae bacterium]|nr:ABC transporter permease [Phaeodactylibacter sp.]MCB9036647.1 ABC transporter permease [Lewinellaceae bacterium]
MLKNYLKIALRNLLREKRYSTINILGLGIGVAVALLLGLYAREEWSFDSFHSKKDRICRVWVKEHYQGEVFFNTVTPVVLAGVLEDNFPEVEKTVQYIQVNNLVKKGSEVSQEQMHVITPSVLEVFDFELLEGDPKDALEGLRKVVLTPAAARKYFGAGPALGQTLSVQLSGQWEEFTVSGIIREAPANSSIQYNMLIPYENMKTLFSDRALTSWTFVYPETYVLLKEGVDAGVLQEKLAPVIDKQVVRIYKAGEYVVGLQPLADIHLNNDYPQGIAAVSDHRYPMILSGIALLVLLLGVVNFVILAIGRSVSRAKEVGIRRVAGALRRQLMQQFWSESAVVTLLAVVVGVLMAQLCLPAFNLITGKSLSIPYTLSSLGLFLSGGLALGLLAGAYPALIVSGFSPLRAIKGGITRLGRGRQMLLRGLVSFQFVLSLCLIICTMVMAFQLQYLQQKNLGFDKEQVVILPYQAAPTADYGTAAIFADGREVESRLRQELDGEPKVLGVAASAHALGFPGWTTLGYTDPSSQQYRDFSYNAVSENYLETMGIGLAAGRSFSADIPSDREKAVVVNESMAGAFGWGDLVGQQLPPPFEGFQLIGILKDFHFHSLHTEIGPLMMGMNPTSLYQVVSDVNYGDLPIPKLALRLAGGDVPATLETIKQAWNKVAPGQPFDFTFLNDALDAQYRAEQHLSTVLFWATGLAILIACLGLFGIATLTTVRRTKEIGVRKVLGASVAQLVFTLNKPITMMVLLASVIAAPIAYLLMQRWLQGFAFHVAINPAWFLLAAALALALAWLSVSWQSVKTARGNPVEALRYE